MRSFFVIGLLAFVVFESQTAEANTTLISTNSTQICLNKAKIKCKNYEKFNDVTCKCECRDGCNACNQPQVWSSTNCYCRCPKTLKCRSYQYWDQQSCSCKCKENRRGCCDGKIWNATSCECQCVNKLACPSNMRFSESQCKCVCKNYKFCKYPQLFNENSCACECPKVKCPENFIYNNLTCECECDRNAKKRCTSRLTFWNSKTCTCECKKSKIECLNGTMVDPATKCTSCIFRQEKLCPGNQHWSKADGKCQCLGGAQDCTIFNDKGMHIWDDINCKCKCNMPDHQIACSIDEYFDYPSCDCICNVSERNCPTPLAWNALTCKCELASLLPSFDKIFAQVNQINRQFPDLRDSLDGDI